jgi:hypothetical protein
MLKNLNHNAQSQLTNQCEKSQENTSITEVELEAVADGNQEDVVDTSIKTMNGEDTITQDQILEIVIRGEEEKGNPNQAITQNVNTADMTQDPTAMTLHDPLW